MTRVCYAQETLLGQPAVAPISSASESSQFCAQVKADGILEYISEDRPPSAVRCVKKLKDGSRSIAELPYYMGVLKVDLPQDIRCFTEGNYLIFYRVRDDAPWSQGQVLVH